MYDTFSVFEQVTSLLFNYFNYFLASVVQRVESTQLTMIALSTE